MSRGGRGSVVGRTAGPVRMCVACGRKAPQADLARFALGPDGIATGRTPGRGAYVCPSGDCARRAESRGLVLRALRRHGR